MCSPNHYDLAYTLTNACSLEFARSWAVLIFINFSCRTSQIMCLCACSSSVLIERVSGGPGPRPAINCNLLGKPGESRRNTEPHISSPVSDHAIRLHERRESRSLCLELAMTRFGAAQDYLFRVLFSLLIAVRALCAPPRSSALPVRVRSITDIDWTREGVSTHTARYLSPSYS